MLDDLWNGIQRRVDRSQIESVLDPFRGNYGHKPKPAQPRKMTGLDQAQRAAIKKIETAKMRRVIAAQDPDAARLAARYRTTPAAR
ncbi:MAG: hypothetical protein AAFU41_08340 [Pseudomonadota bacterium]